MKGDLRPINYAVSVKEVCNRGVACSLCLGRGERDSPKDDLLHRPYLIKKTTRGGRGSKIADFETT